MRRPGYTYQAPITPQLREALSELNRIARELNGPQSVPFGGGSPHLTAEEVQARDRRAYEEFVGGINERNRHAGRTILHDDD